MRRKLERRKEGRKESKRRGRKERKVTGETKPWTLLTMNALMVAAVP